VPRIAEPASTPAAGFTTISTLRRKRLQMRAETSSLPSLRLLMKIGRRPRIFIWVKLHVYGSYWPTCRYCLSHPVFVFGRIFMGYRGNLGCRRWCDGGKKLSDCKEAEGLCNTTGPQVSYNRTFSA